MYKIPGLLFLFAVLFATDIFSQSPHKKGYEIDGVVTGYPDSTRIYLADPGTGTSINIDSAFIVNNKFHFAGTLHEEALNVILEVHKYNWGYKYFWLENSNIKITVEKGNFKNAVITGSKTQAEQEKLSAIIDTTDNDKRENLLFIRNHPNSMVVAKNLSVMATTWGKDTAELIFNNFSEKIKNTPYGRNIKNFIDLNREINIGEKFIDFTQQDLEGKNVSLSDFHGKIVLLEFWASNCGACRESNPELVKYYNEFKDKGFDVLGVSLDGKKEFWADAIKQDKLPWPNVSDLGGWHNKAALIYGISYMPNNVLIDRNGIIISKDLRGDALRNKLSELLK